MLYERGWEVLYVRGERCYVRGVRGVCMRGVTWGETARVLGLRKGEMGESLSAW